jgi:tetratricopeptide (TPR) repeat protein
LLSRALILALLLLCVCPTNSIAQVGGSRSLHPLDSIIAHRDKIQTQKVRRINELKRLQLNSSGLKKYRHTESIYNEYKSFIYDSAFRYARELQRLAAVMKDPVLIMRSKINLGFVLVSAGLFNETLDTLQSISTGSLPDTLKADYYYLIGRTCYDLAEFSRDQFYSVRYNLRGNQYLDSGLRYVAAGDPKFLVMAGLKHLHQAEIDGARIAYEKLLEDHRLTNSQVAVATSTLSFIYSMAQNTAGSREMLIKAAIADILSSTKETVAMRNLAEVLYNEGDIEKAYQYIQIAMQDANFYGANHRKIQVASLFPVIEGRQLSMIESRKNVLTLYAIGTTALMAVIFLFGIIVFRQFRKLQLAKKEISRSNDKLLETNHQLVDSNKIKEEYVIYYFNTTAEYIAKLEGLKRTLDMKLLTKKTEDVRFVVDSINIKREREDLYHNFDKVVLKLFPDFVTSFNALLREEEQIHLKEGQLLNTELRIFALIRMGIHDNEKISRILDYSVATIYTYKTRVRSKSIVPNEEFDRRIMAIRTL